MPELSPKQVAIWITFAALILFVGGKALRGGGGATALNASAFAGTGATSEAGRGEAAGAGGAALATGDDGQPRLWVHVAGAVRRPGIYRLPEGSRVADALRRAGGKRGAADLDRVNLAATLSDGQQVLIPRRGEATPAAAGPGHAVGGTGAASAGVGTAVGDGGAAAAGLAGGAPISLASATPEQLETIDGIGPVTAAKIIQFRDGKGGVASIEELDAIPGIGPATMQTLRQALVP